jgi:hypothetical protein
MAREVNISLRGVLEELPSEVAQLLAVSIRKMSDTQHKLDGVVERLEEGGDEEHCIVDLESTRQSLYKIDNRLSDCMNILSGYVQHMNNPPSAPQPPPSEIGTEQSDEE